MKMNDRVKNSRKLNQYTRMLDVSLKPYNNS